MANLPKKIIIHHSYSPDNRQINDWESTRRYHMSWRHNDISIPAAEAKMLMAAGVDVIPPWKDIGYHAGQERENGKLIRRIGRPETMTGAHCSQQGMNSRSLGYCFVGCYDRVPPTDYELGFAAEWLADWIRKYRLTVNDIEPHSKYAAKSCPGTVFPMDKLRQMVGERI